MPSSLDPDDMPPWLSTLWPRSKEESDIIAGIDDDDCGVLRWNEQLLIVTTDYLNAHPIALELQIGSLFDVGRLVVAASLSDLCGSGAEPKALLIGVTMERSATEEEFKLLMNGVRAESNRWNVPVIGGDTKLGLARSIFSVGIGGAASKSNLFLKNSACAGDLLWCSGMLGSCNAATIGLQRFDLDNEWKRWATSAILMPSVPIQKSHLLSKSCLGRGGIDISDGLGADLCRMCKASHVGVILDSGKIPYDPHVQEVARKLEIEPWVFAFGGGGDFQFLVSSAKSDAEKVQALGFHLIGELTKESEISLRFRERILPLPIVGHRDVRNMVFSEEIMTLIELVKQS